MYISNMFVTGCGDGGKDMKDWGRLSSENLDEFDKGPRSKGGGNESESSGALLTHLLIRRVGLCPVHWRAERGSGRTTFRVGGRQE